MRRKTAPPSNVLFGALAMTQDEPLVALLRGDAERQAADGCTYVRLLPGDLLHANGQPCQQLYVVCSGLLKSVRAGSDRAPRVGGFAVGGDLLGMDGIMGESYRSDVVALACSELVALPLTRLSVLGRTVPGFNDALYRAMGRTLEHERDLMMLLRLSNTTARMACFLARIARRHHGAGALFPGIALGLAKGDVASYLSMSTETVERALAALGHGQLLADDNGAVAAGPASTVTPNWCQLDAAGGYMVAGRA